jgi:hypothetical protein
VTQSMATIRSHRASRAAFGLPNRRMILGSQSDGILPNSQFPLLVRIACRSYQWHAQFREKSCPHG